MSEQLFTDTESKFTTSNGHEILNPAEKLSAEKLQADLSGEFGLDGANPGERIEQLKGKSLEEVAELLDYINRTVQGSEDSLANNEKTMKIGETSTIRIEDRYDVFDKMMRDIRESSPDVNPARTGDVLALGVVLLHPFYDGNGRTARVLGSVFREDYDTNDYKDDFDVITEPRDEARKRGGFVVNGYIPQFPEGFDQSDPTQVSDYLKNLLQEESSGAYVSCFGQAELHSNNSE